MTDSANVEHAATFPSSMIEIRSETAADHDAIKRVLRSAFADDTESRLVDLLRERQKCAISLVATADAYVVGHVLFSTITIDQSPEGFRGLGLAPVSVIREYQRRGIGSALILEGLKRAKHDGYDAVVVLGHPHYYRRFGFQIASASGLANEYGADDAFMVLEQRGGVLARLKGVVRYAPEFREVGC